MEVLNPTPRYASFGNRLIAYIIDYLILGVISSAIFVAYALTTGLFGAMMSGGPRDPAAAQALGFQMIGIFGFFFILLLLLGWLYFALQESGKSQATLGKRAMNIKVCSLDGEAISFGRASGRFFAKILSRMIMWIGYIMAAFTEKKQALHDIIAETLVIEG